MRTITRAASKFVRFGEVQELLFDANLSPEIVDDVVWYTKSEIRSFKLLTFTISAEGKKLGDSEQALNGHCLRGLEKMMPGGYDRQKQKHKVVKSVIKQYKLLKNSNVHVDERDEALRSSYETLSQSSRSRARTIAVNDEAAARAITRPDDNIEPLMKEPTSHDLPHTTCGRANDLFTFPVFHVVAPGA